MWAKSQLSRRAWMLHNVISVVAGIWLGVCVFLDEWPVKPITAWQAEMFNGKFYPALSWLLPLLPCAVISFLICYAWDIATGQSPDAATPRGRTSPGRTGRAAGPPLDASAAPRPTPANPALGVQTCPQCGRRVVPKADRSCPSCQAVLG